MANSKDITTQQKFKVLTKLFENGCDTEKKLQELNMEGILKIKNITIPDMVVINELQKHCKTHTLFSFLGGGANEQPKQIE